MDPCFNGGYMSNKKSNTMFATNYICLRDLKRKYEPDFVFRKWFAREPAHVEC